MDVPHIIESSIKNSCYTAMVVGARGVGKTYGALEFTLQQNVKFIYMRRTVTECDMIMADSSLNPFNRLNSDLHRAIEPVKESKYITKFVDENGSKIGIMLPLSGIANIRGFDASEYQLLIYDEFIPERHVRPLKDEHLAFLNALETINRNRELLGENPVFVLCLANSNRIDNALFMGLNLVSKFEKMQREGQTAAFLRDRSLTLINVEGSNISSQKALTSVYKLAKGTEFAGMALSNRFIGEDDRVNVKSLNLQEYRPFVAVGELCIYIHKTESRYYISQHMSGSVKHYGAGTTELQRFRRQYSKLIQEFFQYNMYFESTICEILFRRYIGQA